MAIDSSSSIAAEGFKSSALFEQIEKTLKSKGAELVKTVGAVYLFKVQNNGKEASWIVDAKNGSGSVKRALEGEKAEVTISMKDDDVFQLLSGKMAAPQAYFQGRLRVQGNMGLAMKLQGLMQKHLQQGSPLKAKL